MIILISLLTLIVLLYKWMENRFSSWSKRGIKGPKPMPFVGNFGKVFLQIQSPDDVSLQAYNQYPEEQVVGLFQGFRKTLLLRDPELIKMVMIKDFPIFQDRGVKMTDDRLSDHLFSVEGEAWRILRTKLTPIFTSGKLRNMTPLIDKCVEEYINYIDRLIEKGEDQEIRSLVGKYTLEVIGSCAFGIEMNAFSDKANLFREIAVSIFQPSYLGKLKEFTELMVPGTYNLLYKCFGISEFNKKLKRFFINLVSEVVQQREGKAKTRNDFMDLMISLKEQGRVGRRDDSKTTEIDIDNMVLAAQAFVFYAAGFETSAATMSFLLHELAVNKAVQDRAYVEIKTVLEKHNNAVNYDSIKEMTYLEMAFDETLRKYPIIANLVRRASSDYTFPGTKIKIDKGTVVMMSVRGIQTDPKYYPNPDVFDPERFSAENRHSIPSCAYLPFGEGPRNCIGMRFAKVQSMMAMASFLNRFKVEPSSKTQQSGLEFSPKGATLTSQNGIWLKISRR